MNNREWPYPESGWHVLRQLLLVCIISAPVSLCFNALVYLGVPFYLTMPTAILCILHFVWCDSPAQR